MNALANSQHGELKKFLYFGYDGKPPVTFERYTGQERDEERDRIMANPPDILLTNYVMLELILTRPYERKLIEAAQGLRFLVMDELHTYRGRQGADVSLLVRRVRDLLNAQNLQCVGTSATLAGSGTYDQQREEVAEVASQIFGSEVAPQHIIGETLKRSTQPRDLSDPDFNEDLTRCIADPKYKLPIDYKSFISDPLAIWLESAFGIVTDENSDRLIRMKPRSISGDSGAAYELSELTGLSVEQCISKIQAGLLAGCECEKAPEARFPPFAFRLHQFISRGSNVYASIDTEQDRHITVNPQQYVPGDRSQILLPMVFCRECGQEYYCVRMSRDPDSGQRIFKPRELGDMLGDEESEAGFLYYSTHKPWPEDSQSVLERLPDDWLEEYRGALRVRRSRREYLPKPLKVGGDGRESQEGLHCHYLSAPFRFCPWCDVSYGPHQISDFAKLASLDFGGRSTATTIMSLSAIRGLRSIESIPKEARKLLSFTDNRQDASLQAGHFNDFIEIGLLRWGIYQAVCGVGQEGVRHEELTQSVFDALDLPLESYASDPAVRFQGLRDTQRALRDVLGYRIYRDLRRGWRVSAPNLEQCGLLEIRYLSLDEVCSADDIWQNCHAALVTASPETRMKVARTLLDYMHRELVIKVDYLDSRYQERIQQQSSQRLVEPWAIGDNEEMQHAAVLYPRSQKRGDYRGNVFLSPRGGFGQYLRRPSVFTDYGKKLSLDDTDNIIKQLLKGLKVAGLVEEASEPRFEDDVPGYQLPASAMVWTAGDGTQAFHDLIRVPNQSSEGAHPNPFFIDFYSHVASETQGIEAREHTAQVDSDDRQDREDRFREANLPILYCSPTMELGVDIKELNVVNMRNIPPTPANYAQRSGRAGRGGQPALVFSYCSTGSSHDQYFFKRPELMVSGAVSPPRLDLANEDLIRAHVHAIWLTETGMSLGTSLRDILDLTGDSPTLELLDSIRHAIEAEAPKHRSIERARLVLETISDELEGSDWYHEGWLDEVINQVSLSFDNACERWRGLYQSALSQAKAQDAIIRDASRNQADKREAERLRHEAESQLKLLTEADNIAQSDFYSYRYFASEGFLPGYSFPRLPLSAYIPGQRKRKQRDDMISRPRFLAISEFGPRAVIYHEGSRYIINKAILPVGDEDVLTVKAKLCGRCGYLHPIFQGEGPDLCENCGSDSLRIHQPLFRLRNVSTRRRERINCDEEERVRLGYDIITSLRFNEYESGVSCRVASVEKDGEELARLTYGHAANLWRINLGWARRKNKGQYGFVIDMERGYWARNEQMAEEDADDPMSPKTSRVIPYVEDHRNCMLLEPSEDLDMKAMASLQSALKNAIQVRYQLEDNELAVEPLPTRDDRRMILFYEAAEGGAGVLRRLLDDRDAFAGVAKEALDICHFDLQTGQDRHRGKRANEDCEAACYDCLMNYTNQRDHPLLDRQSIRELLLDFTASKVETSPSEKPRSEHLRDLMDTAGSELERQWLRYLEEHRYRLPSQAQVFIQACKTRPDFIYEKEQTAIYIDGPIHDFPDRQQRDLSQNECMEDYGYTVIRFGHKDNWDEIVSRFPNIFGVNA
jgi:very-short-patch-repair endonuclease